MFETSGEPLGFALLERRVQIGSVLNGLWKSFLGLFSKLLKFILASLWWGLGAYYFHACFARLKNFRSGPPFLIAFNVILAPFWNHIRGLEKVSGALERSWAALGPSGERPGLF